MRIVYVGAHQSVHTRRWVSFFAQRGHDVHLLSCGMSADVRDEPYTVHDLGGPVPTKMGYLGRIPQARSLIRSLRPDIVHAHYATGYGAIGTAAGIRPTIVTAHGDDVLLAPRNPAKRAVVRSVLRRADLVTVPSEQMRDAVLRLQGGAGRAPLVFQYGVDTGRLARIGDSVRSVTAARSGRPLRIVSARPLMALYRIDLLVHALEVLHRRGVAVECDILGDGPDRARLVDISRAAGLTSTVRFRGVVRPHAVADVLANADVAVSLSSSDGASIAVLEAMAVGLVTVLSDIPANRAWACPEGSVLVAPHADAVAEGLLRAGALDRSGAAAANRRIVGERADRDVNLGRFEAEMLRLHHEHHPTAVT